MFRMNDRGGTIGVSLLAHGYALTLMTLAEHNDYDHVGTAWGAWLGPAVSGSLSHAKTTKKREVSSQSHVPAA